MNASNKSSQRAISRPLIHIQGCERESSDGDDGPGGNKPPDSTSLNLEPGLINGSRYNAIHSAVSILTTKWRFLLLITVAIASFGMYVLILF